MTQLAINSTTIEQLLEENKNVKSVKKVITSDLEGMRILVVDDLSLIHISEPTRLVAI